MTTYLNVIIAGLLTGAVYGLMALGLSIIFGVIRVVNFAHGEMMVLAMYAVILLNQRFGLDPLALVPVAAALLFLFGYALQRGLINRWIANRIIDWSPSHCLHCRLPIIVGQKWTVVSNGEVTARFHEPCHGEWLTEQERLARRSLGLPIGENE